MGWLSNVKNSVKNQFTDEYEDEEYMDEEEMTEEEAPRVVPRAPERPARVDPTAAVPRRPVSTHVASRPVGNSAVRPYTMVVVSPHDYKDAEKIADHIKQGRPVVMNMESADADAAQRIVDFVQGVMYATDGHMDTVGDKIFLCAPNNMAVSKENFAAYAAGGLSDGVPRFDLND